MTSLNKSWKPYWKNKCFIYGNLLKIEKKALDVEILLAVGQLQVNCLEGVCGFSGMQADSERKYKPKNPNQQWRFPLAILLHPGILQVSCLVTFISIKRVTRSVKCEKGSPFSLINVK